MAYAFIFNYTFPVIAIIVFYSQVSSSSCVIIPHVFSSFKIVKAVVAHEAALRAQAKKMNVDSLRSNAKDDGDSAEVRIAKVRLVWDICYSYCKSPIPGCHH